MKNINKGYMLGEERLPMKNMNKEVLMFLNQF